LEGEGILERKEYSHSEKGRDILGKRVGQSLENQGASLEKKIQREVYKQGGKGICTS